MEKKRNSFWREKADLSLRFLGVNASRVLYDRPELRLKTAFADTLFPFRYELLGKSEKLTCLAIVSNPKFSFLEIYPYYRPRGKFETGGKEGLHHFEFRLNSEPGNLNKVHEALEESRGDLRASHTWVTSDHCGLSSMAVDFAKVFDEQEEGRLYKGESDYEGDYHKKGFTRTLHGLLGFKIRKKLGESLRKLDNGISEYGYFKHGYEYSPDQLNMHIQFTIGASVRMHLKDLIDGTYDKYWETEYRLSEKLKCGYASFIYSFNLKNMTLEMYLIGGDEFPCKFWFRLRDRPDAPFQASRVLMNLGVDVVAETWAALPEENCAYWIPYTNIMETPGVRSFAQQLKEKYEKRKKANTQEKKRMLLGIHKFIRDFNSTLKEQIQNQIKEMKKNETDKIEMFNAEAIPEALREVRKKEISSPAKRRKS